MLIGFLGLNIQGTYIERRKVDDDEKRKEKFGFPFEWKCLDFHLTRKARKILKLYILLVKFRSIRAN